jgi:hypothetical protein
MAVAVLEVVVVAVGVVVMAAVVAMAAAVVVSEDGGGDGWSAYSDHCQLMTDQGGWEVVVDGQWQQWQSCCCCCGVTVGCLPWLLSIW